MFITALIAAALTALPQDLTGPLAPQQQDTLKTVTIVADRGITVSRTETVKTDNSLTITDILSQSPSLLVVDNGGAAGLKTVSLRGMGSPHTAIYVDGVRVGNVQSGQADLGMLGIENFSAATIDYAQNSVSFQTAKPKFAAGRNTAGNIKMEAGSFGTYKPSGRLDFKLSDAVSLSANAAGTKSEGDFPYGEDLRRINNDISQIKGGLDLFGITGGGDWLAKVWYNGSKRGTPGSTDWPSTDRQADRNAFAQGLWRQQFSRLYSLQISAKASYDKVFYQSEWGDSDYGQTELQLNSSHKFKLNRWLDLSAAADLQSDGLKSTYYSAHRTGVIGTAGAAVRLKGFTADFALEYDGTFDREGQSLQVLSPSADFSVSPGKGFTFAGFARRAFRAPTFNELYYPGYGNPDLKSEDAWLTDLGLQWRSVSDGKWSAKASIDGFCNILSNKITSAPSPSDPSLWMPYNIGKVRSLGTDISAGAAFSDGDWKASLDAKYTFQSATDRTADSYSFGEQIAYVAKHSACVNATAAFRRWTLDASWKLRAGRRDSYGEMPDWDTVDLFLSKAFAFGGSDLLTFKLSIYNLAGKRYELASGYPMPGRSVLGGIQFKF